MSYLRASAHLPPGWETVRLGSVAATIVPMRDKPPEFRGDIPWIRIEDFDGKYISDSKSKQYVDADIVRDMRLKIYPAGTVLCSCSCSMGATAIVARPLVSNQTFIGIVPGRQLVSEFLFYALHAYSPQLQSIATGAIQQYLSKQDFKSLRLAVPPAGEQRRIADFLDRETVRIDDFIAKKRTLADRLNESRDALISRTLACGLPPDEARAFGFNPRPPLKPSGIKWIGSIPQHWSTRRLRHISDGITVGVVVNPSSYVSDDGVPFLLGGDVREFVINTSGCNRCPSTISDGLLRKSRLCADDLVVVRVGYPGVAAVAPPELEGANCASMMIVRKHARFFSPWLAYVFNSRIGRDQIGMVQYGAAQKQFNISHAVDFTFPFPPLREQQAIVAFLDRERTKINRAIGSMQSAADRVAEYRTALITAAVTGQIDVRQYKARGVASCQ